MYTERELEWNRYSDRGREIQRDAERGGENEKEMERGMGGGGGYGPHMCEVWWAGMQWEARRIKKSDHHSKRETGGHEGQKKKIAEKTKCEKSKKFWSFGRSWPRPHSLPKRP